MRWKFSRDSSNIYTCCWCFHVKTGTIVLGLWSLLSQIAGLALVTVILTRSDLAQPWLSSIVMPMMSNNTCCSMMGGSTMMPPDAMMPGIDADTMRDAMTGNNGVMRDTMLGTNGMMSPDNSMMGSNEMMSGRDRMMGNDVGPGPGMMGSNGMMGSSGMMGGGGGGMMAGRNRMMDEDFSEYVKALKPSSEDTPPSDEAVVKIPGTNIEAIVKTEEEPDIFRVEHHMPYRRRNDWDEGNDKFFLILVMFGCIAASGMLIYGVVKGWAGYMIPYMGLQVFDFCVSCLTVFTYFSDIPGIKRWIAARPDSFPMKSCLLAMDTDRLVLSLVLISVGILVIKAYLMGMVWSCYKYVKETQAGVTRRRSADGDRIGNPEDTEMLLPPKYEDIVSESATDAANPPPPYCAE